MKNSILVSAVMLLFLLGSCSDDDSNDLIDFTVSFSSSTVSLSEEDTSEEITLTFSRSASESGTIVISYEGVNAAYGTDFSTDPAAASGTISLPVAQGDLNTSFTFNKLADAIEGTTKTVTFSLDSYSSTDWSNGSTASTLVSYTEIAATSGVVNTENGGSNQPNQVYFDFSSNSQTVVQRDTWEIALYNGAENRVYLNSALLVSAAELTGVTDILSITEASDLSETMDLFTYSFMTQQMTPVSVGTVTELLAGLPVGYTQYGNLEGEISFTDRPEGALEGTAIAEVSTTAEENYVYIVSLGNEIPSEPADPGSIATTGDHRGFMKVRVLSDGNGYTIQYADLNETESYNEVTVAKDDAFNLTAFSLTNGETVSVEPSADQWDINLSGVFSFYGAQGPIVAGLTYSDYVVHNTLGGVGLYAVTVEGDAPTYANFSMSDVDEASFVFDNRALIGSSWRSTSTGAYDNLYYVLVDADGNYYKFIFNAHVSAEGERGNYQFTYERL